MAGAERIAISKSKVANVGGTGRHDLLRGTELLPSLDCSTHGPMLVLTDSTTDKAKWRVKPPCKLAASGAQQQPSTPHLEGCVQLLLALKQPSLENAVFVKRFLQLTNEVSSATRCW